MLESQGYAKWNPEVRNEFAKFPKEKLIARADKLAKEFPQESDQVDLFIKTLKGEKF